MNTAPPHPSALDWREGRRLRAWELHELGWSQRAIAEALGVSSGAVSQWFRRARSGGSAALRRQPGAGRPPKLRAAQRAQWPALLAPGAEAFGFRGQVWTCKRVAEVIRRTFGIVYHPAHVNVSRLLHQVGLSVQQPVQRATQRDETAIQHWRDERWPALKKSHRRGTDAPLGRPIRLLFVAPSGADLGATRTSASAAHPAHA